jgi:hypothetical protein
MKWVGPGMLGETEAAKQARVRALLRRLTLPALSIPNAKS